MIPRVLRRDKSAPVLHAFASIALLTAWSPGRCLLLQFCSCSPGTIRAISPLFPLGKNCGSVAFALYEGGRGIIRSVGGPLGLLRLRQHNFEPFRYY